MIFHGQRIIACMTWKPELISCKWFFTLVTGNGYKAAIILKMGMIFFLGIKNHFALIACPVKLAVFEMVMQLKNIELARILTLGVIGCLERHLTAMSLFYLSNDFSVLFGDLYKLKFFSFTWRTLRFFFLIKSLVFNFCLTR